jgi:hypothetical protein
MGRSKVIYELTFKGLLSTVLGEEHLIQSVMDRIELYMLKSKYNGILIEDGKFNFIHIKKGK